jgi:hypothetical protein
MGAPDRHLLYELCTQTPARDVALLRAIHGGAPRLLGEDFAGTAALSRAWVAAVRGGRAIAVDHDGDVLARAGRSRRIARRVADVRAVRDRCDLLVALNFSIGELHARADLVDYLRGARRRLTRGGLFACDLYGGRGAWRTGTLRERRALPRGGKVDYEWEQRSADLLSGRVVDALHFRVSPKRGGRGTELRDAFVYDWRLWSPPELGDALRDAGFAAVEWWSRFEHARDGQGRLHPLRHAAGDELADDWCLFVVGRR